MFVVFSIKSVRSCNMNLGVENLQASCRLIAVVHKSAHPSGSWRLLELVPVLVLLLIGLIARMCWFDCSREPFWFLLFDLCVSLTLLATAPASGLQSGLKPFM